MKKTRKNCHTRGHRVCVLRKITEFSTESPSAQYDPGFLPTVPESNSVHRTVRLPPVSFQNLYRQLVAQTGHQLPITAAEKKVDAS